MRNPGGQATPTAEKCNDPATNDDEWMTMLLIRMLYVAFYMANGFLQPFLPVYYESLGYKGQIVGLLGSISPFTTFLAGPFWGLLSDTLQAPFFILYTTIAICLVGQVLVGMVNDPYVLMALVCIKSVFGTPIRSIIDSLVLQQIADRSQFGKMRLWGLIGSGLGASVAGYFVEFDPVEVEVEKLTEQTSIFYVIFGFFKGLSGYRLLFFVHVILHIPVFIAVRWLQVDRRNNDARKTTERKTELSSTPQAKLLTSREVLLSVLKNHDAVVFFLMVYAMGISGGIADNFTYARFREIGVSGGNIGASRLFSSGAGALMFWYSSPLSSFLGSERVILFSLLTISIRFGLYTIMDHPIYAYVGEAMRGLTFGCFWSTATVYASDISPEGARATMLLLLNGSYNGIGRSTGAILGGQVQASFGTANVFKFGSVAYLLTACLFAIYKAKFAPHPADRTETKEKIQ
jgi:PPP family 3-phenylpropionic acid transporter